MKLAPTVGFEKVTELNPFWALDVKVGRLDATDCVAWRLFPDLSFHWDTLLPTSVMLLRSAPSNHRDNPEMEVGWNELLIPHFQDK